MTVQTSENVFGFQQYYASKIGQDIIAPACILNGLQGAVTVTQAIGSPGVWYVNVNFPRYVEVPTYPSTCNTNETSLVDVSWMKENSPYWVSDVLAPLLAATPVVGSVYADTLDYIVEVIGAFPYTFSYSSPTYISY
jgi:hypothetical protein